jgi:pimeloyl-ACP methyl ester carboxylesterase
MTETARPAAAADEFCEVAGGIRLCYRTEGEPDGEPLLLIAGLGQSLIAWPQPFVDELVGRGLRIIRLDNRDAGRSSRVQVRPPGTVRQLVRRFDARQYTLAEMAGDVVGLLDALELDSVHVAGMSMGGMIAQTLAARHPARVRTLTSIISNTGHWRTGRIALSTMSMMAKPPATEREAVAERMVALMRHIGSRGFPFDEDEIRTVALASFDRGEGPNPAGVARQIGAIYKSGDRTAELAAVRAPTLVVHGDRDPMVHPSGGAATAAAIPGARLVTIPGMGHDLPRGAWPQLLELIGAHVGAGTPPAAY